MRLLLFLGLLAFGPMGAAEPDRSVLLEHEVEDMPPGTPARDSLFARSPGARIAFGSYVSVQVNVDENGDNVVGDAANEPSIAVNPVNPANMVIGWRQFDTVTSSFRQAGVGYTFDGGDSWTFPGALDPGLFRSDPSLDANASGTFFYQSLKSDLRMDVFRSEDGGVTWAVAVPSFGGDKNWMAIDHTGGMGQGHIYGIWQRFSNPCCGDRVFTRSVDGGLSYQTPVRVPRSPTFGTMAVGPDGAVYAAGMDGTNNQGPNPNTFVVATSTNAQDASLPPAFTSSVVEMGGAMSLFTGPNPGGLLGQANVLVHPVSGEPYLLASVDPNPGLAAMPEHMNVHLSRKDVEGWTLPVRINDDPYQTWQWMAAGSVAPNGRIDVIWLDTRASVGNINIAQLYYAYSWDRGDSWSPNVAVTPSFDSSIGYPNQAKMGDYMSIISDDIGADVAFPGTFNGEQDVYYVRLFPDCNGNGVSDVVDVADPAVVDCDANQVPDSCEVEPFCLGAAAVQDGLTVERSLSGDLTLTWGASCAGADDDYAVYEGVLGSFASHAPRACTTGGATSTVLAPASGSAYYLVVPTHADREGSYGKGTANSERPPGQDACFPQQVRACGD